MILELGENPARQWSLDLMRRDAYRDTNVQRSLLGTVLGHQFGVGPTGRRRTIKADRIRRCQLSINPFEQWLKQVILPERVHTGKDRALLGSTVLADVSADRQPRPDIEASKK